MVGSVPPPTVPGQPQAPVPADAENTEVHTEGHAQGATDVHSADAPTLPQQPKSLEVETGFEKSKGGNQGGSPEPPPNLSGADKERFLKGVAVAEAMGAGPAVAELAAQFKDQPVTDINEFFKNLDNILKEKGAVPPPPEFNKLEAKELGLRQGSGGGGAGGAGGAGGSGGAGGAGGAGGTNNSGDVGGAGRQTGGGGGVGGSNGLDTGNRLGGGGGPGWTPPADTGSFRETVKTTTWAVLGSMNSGDIEAIAFLVLMQASKSAQEDLKAIMAQVKAINNAKSKQRELLANMQKMSSEFAAQTGSQVIGGKGSCPSGTVNFNGAVVDAGNPANPTGYLEVKKYAIPPSQGRSGITKAELDSAIDRAKGDLDSMSEMGEMESLRLQMAMDRMSKMMSTLSNLLKKISDTANGITQNLK